MTPDELQKKSIEALKSFNNTIVTSRLYPPDAPQIARGVERGYKALKLFLRDFGFLTFSLQGNEPYLCGHPLSQEVVDSFPNLVIYRQLRLLNLPTLAIGLEMDRFAFGQLVAVFNSAAAKIKNEGGGLSYITGLGLSSFFPEDQEPALPIQSEKKSEPQVRPQKFVKVRQEILDSLLGKDNRPASEKQLRIQFESADAAVEILAAGIVHVLREIQKKKMILASPTFVNMLERAEKIMAEQVKARVIRDLAGLLTVHLRSSAICVLFAQQYPGAFGTALYESIVNSLNQKILTEIFVLFREQLAKAQAQKVSDAGRLELIGKSFLRLMNTQKGKQFLGAEKAKNLIHEGERSRIQKRKEAGVQSLLSGNGRVLKSDELVRYLPEAVRLMVKSGSNEQLNTILPQVAVYLEEEEAGRKRILLESIIKMGSLFLIKGRYDLIDLLLESIKKTLLRIKTVDETTEEAVAFLHKVMQLSWGRSEDARADAILSFFHRARFGQGGASDDLKGLVSKVQDRGINRGALPQLLAQCLARPKDKALRYRLTLQGPVAIRFLVESLINAENTDDRIVIIDLLTTQRAFLPQIISERLPEHMPWYGKRNLIKLLGETGGEDDADKVLPYLRFDDFRVQREAFLTIYKIAGKAKKQLLLRALTDSSEMIKMQIIAALATLCDPEVAAQLGELLEEQETFSDRNRNDLLIQILDTLGRCPCTAAYKVVQTFLQSRGKRDTRKISEQVWTGAERALKYIDQELQQARKKHVQASKLRKNALKQAAKLTKAKADQRIITGLPQEQTVRSLLAQGDTEGAGQQLLLLIENIARTRNFALAEKLREWLIQIDHGAFGRIIQAAELIEREKIAAIDKSHLEIWSELYDILTSDEFNSVYHALKHRKYSNEEVIVRQGTMLNALFFINSGKVKLYFEDQGGEVLLRTLERGEVFGGSSFFEASVWTLSVASVGPSEISVLAQDTLSMLRREFPGLEPTLRDFCMKFEDFETIIQKSERDRREHERFKISGRVGVSLIDSRGQGTGVSSTVELSDISQGGVSYRLHIATRDNASLLLGRKVKMSLPHGDVPGAYMDMEGDILAVRSAHPAGGDYSVHVRFNQVVDDSKLREIVNASRRETLP